MRADLRIEGDMACEAGFLVLMECLDETFESRTACFPLTVMLPRLDPRLHEVNLVAPYCQARERRDMAEAAEARYAGDSAWGCVQDWRDPVGAPVPTHAVIERLRFATHGAAADDAALQVTQEHFARDQRAWWQRLAEWIGVVSSQDLTGFGRRRRGRSLLGLSMWNPDVPEGQESGFSTLNLGDLRPFCGEPLTKSQLATCMRLTGEEVRPPLAWLLLCDARSLMRYGEYRRAVLDAATATELALTEILDKYATATATPAVMAKVKKTKTLGRLNDLARQLVPSVIPADVQARVIDPRNAATHEGQEPTQQIAELAMSTAIELVGAAYPLSNFGFGEDPPVTD